MSSLVAGTIYEWFGYRSDDPTSKAAQAAAQEHCPFLNDRCTKTGRGGVRTGVCSTKPTQSSELVTVCPKRLYFNKFEMLARIADDAFTGRTFKRDMNGLPSLVPANQARHEAATNHTSQIGVFGGEGWGGEINLPAAVQGGASYKVDFTLVLVDPTGALEAFAPVEVQSIDTTGSTSTARAALQAGRNVVADTVGLNWENVSKRIIPQLVFKGLMLQGESQCETGMYFVTPEPVFQRVMMRLGNATLKRLRNIPKQPGSITFVRYEYDLTGNPAHGSPLPLTTLSPVTISTSDMSLAFISPENLPAAGSYETKIVRRL